MAMDAIKVVFQQKGKGKQPIELVGCERVRSSGGKLTGGELTLQFAARSQGAKELAARLAEDEGFLTLSGRMSVTEHRDTTDYECAYMTHDGRGYVFTVAYP
jgi:hypothetical protein